MRVELGSGLVQSEFDGAGGEQLVTVVGQILKLLPQF